MRLVVTRPQADSERTAAALRARGHEVLVAPLLRVEPVATDLSGGWGGVIITSANAPGAIVGNSARAALVKLPLIAVGQRSADAARQAGFTDVTSAGGEVRAADLVAELVVHGVAAEMAVVYRAVPEPFPPELTAALQAGDVDAVLHFSKRSAENYIAGARQAGIIEQALAVRHFCLARPIAEPLSGAGAGSIAVAKRPDELALIGLLEPAKG